jgi:hypothetical protein
VSGANLSDYTVTSTNGTLTVDKATLTLTATPASRPYGSANPALTGTVAGFVNGDTESSATTGTLAFTTAATPASGVGSYAAVGAGLAAANYSFVQAAANAAALTVTPAPLTVTASGTMTYGGAAPTLTPVYSGWVNGDTAAALSGAPSLSTAVTSSTSTGSYPITVTAGTLAAANYGFTFSNSMLTIAPAAQTITFAALPAQTYGGPPLTLTATASSGLPVAFPLISGPATLSASTLTLTGGGTVTVVATQAGNGNYQAAPAVQRSFAVTAPGLALSVSSLSFDSQALHSGSAAQTVTVQNTGSAALVLTGIAASGDFGQSNNCGLSLAAGANCSVEVTFRPSQVGTRAGSLMVATALAGTQTVALTGSGTDFSFSVPSGTVSAKTVAGGGTAAWVLTITPGTFTGMVALSCTTVPATAACAVIPASIPLTAGGAPVTVTVTVATTARGTAPPWGGPRRPPLWPWLLLQLLTLVLGLLLAFHRLRPRRWLLGAVVGGALLAAGCGGISNLVTAGHGTPPGAYRVTVTATVGNSVRTVPLSLTIE